MRRLVCLLGLVFLCSLSASAQGQSVPIVDVVAGYTFEHVAPGAGASSFSGNGGVASAAFNLTSWGSLVAEVGGIHVSNINGVDVDATASTYMAGPKITLFHRSKLSPFGQALFGFEHTNGAFNGTGISHNSFAFSPGAGLDWNMARHFGVRLAQVDYLLARVPSSTNQVNWNNFRYSAGLLFRF